MLITTYYSATHSTFAAQIVMFACTKCFCIASINSCETEQQRPLEDRVDMTSINKRDQLYVKLSQQLLLYRSSLQSSAFRSVINFSAKNKEIELI